MYGSPPMGDADYKAAWDSLLLPIASSFQPQLILISAGFDAARGDPLGDCDLTPQGYAYLTHQLTKLNCPIVLALEGGYNICSVKYGFAACLSALIGGGVVGEEVEEGRGFGAVRREAMVCIDEAIEAQRPYWEGVFADR